MWGCDALASALLACGVADTIAAAAAAAAAASFSGGSKQQPQPVGAQQQQRRARGVIHRYTTRYTSFKTTIQLNNE